MRTKYCFALLALFANHVWAQNDSSFYNLAIANAKNTIHSSEDVGDPIYNGIEHLDYPASAAGFAYFGSNDWQKGSLQYRNVLYNDIYLKYDLVQNVVVVQYIDKVRGVTLFTPWIQRFSFLNSDFIYLPPHSLLPSGIYQQLSSGIISLYVKRSKLVQETIYNLSVERKFVEKDFYYALKNGIYYNISKKKTVINLMVDKKVQMKSFLKTIGTKYRDDPETFIRKAIDYYNLLSR